MITFLHVRQHFSHRDLCRFKATVCAEDIIWWMFSLRSGLSRGCEVLGRLQCGLPRAVINSGSVSLRGAAAEDRVDKRRRRLHVCCWREEREAEGDSRTNGCSNLYLCVRYSDNIQGSESMKSFLKWLQPKIIITLLTLLFFTLDF